MALDEIQKEDMEKHLEETREYWRRVSESEGFDLEGITPPRCNAMMCVDDKTMPFRYSYMTLVNRYARMGIHRYNMSQGTNFKALRIQKFNFTMGCLSSYYITLEAREPGTVSLTTFQVGVAEKSFGDLHLKCFIARPKGTPKTTNQPYQLDDIAPKYELPRWPSDLNDTRKFYEVKESELKSNDWIHLYLELAICRNDPLIPAGFLSQLKIVKVSIETSEDVEPNERLQAKSATFYITFKGLLNARVGEIGVKVERKVIVRRVVDELTGDFTLFCGFGFYIGEEVEERPMTALRVPQAGDCPMTTPRVPQAGDCPMTAPRVPQAGDCPMKCRRRVAPLDMSWINNLRSFYEQNPIPK